MKWAIIFLVIWILWLEFVVQRAEHKSKKMKKEQERQREITRKQREDWANRYRNY
jgi:flagellar biosynthesis/type III secretory pathway M-ring protein FliF/YscJ